MKRRLLVARALINEPDLVVLDEPTTGLDPQARLAVWRAMEELRDRGVTLLLTTHYMEEAARLCDRLVIMDLGRIVAEGEPVALIREHQAENLEEVFLDLTGRHLRED
jgi:lipooligosaccharide transport system ATP-binding protein